MSSAKSKKSKHSTKKKSSKKISEVEQADLADDSRQEIVFKHVLTGLLFIYLLYYLFQLYASLDNTFFWADENKHAYICTVVSEIKGVPKILPDDLYGDYRRLSLVIPASISYFRGNFYGHCWVLCFEIF
jgi:hypothetical protein